MRAIKYLSWLACAIDSEGSITPYLRRGRYKEATVRVANSNLDYLRFARAIMGGKIYPNRNTGLGKRPQWVLKLCQKESVIYILTLIEPYLIIKKKLCRRVLNWLIQSG